MKKPLIAILALVFVVAGCGDDEESAPTTVPFVSGPAPTVTNVEFQFLESLPVQVRAVVTGELPTPCHGLSTHVTPEADGQVAVVMTVTQPPADTVCAQVIEPFEEILDLGAFAPGTYTLLLDGVAYPFTI